MTDEHDKAAITTAKGEIKEGVGKLTGNRKLETEGKVGQGQGKVQKGLGRLQDAIHKGS